MTALDHFEVRHISALGERFTINLASNECTCRKWILTGIPCVHAITCMRYMNINPKDFITNYYKKPHYETVYQLIIYPTLGQN